MLRRYFINLVEKAVKQNENNIISFAESDSNARFIDLGCDDGKWTLRVAKSIGTIDIFGIEIVKNRANIAKRKGINIITQDLNRRFPIDSNSVDVVHANQVIEHIVNTDQFLSEIYRVLKSGGYAILSTENLASWHNIFALLLGFQPFSMTNFSIKGCVGNPFGLWKKDEGVNKDLLSWQHNRLFSFFGLKDLCIKHGFIVEDIKTTGYYPIHNVFSRIDPIHGHWLTIKIRKPI